MQNPTRRSFIKASAALAGTAFAPNILFGQDKALKQLNVASIGCNGKGASDISEISPGNRIAFLCDVDKGRAKGAMEKFPDAKYFSDYREMFASVADQIDVVTVSTPDHMHFPIAVEAIKHGKPVMVQKPLCNNLWEARALANLAKQKGVLTVMGNQGATTAGTRVLREWIEAGLIGEADQVEAILEEPLRRCAGDVLDVVEDAERWLAHGCPLLRRELVVLVIVSRRKLCHPTRRPVRLYPHGDERPDATRSGRPSGGRRL